MFKKIIFLVNKEKIQNCYEQKANGSIWESQQEVFPSEIEAEKKGWTVDAIKVLLKTKSKVPSHPSSSKLQEWKASPESSSLMPATADSSVAWIKSVWCPPTPLTPTFPFLYIQSTPKQVVLDLQCISDPGSRAWRWERKCCADRAYEIRKATRDERR